MSGSDGTRLAGHLAARLGAWLSCNWRQRTTRNPAPPAPGCSRDAHQHPKRRYSAHHALIVAGSVSGLLAVLYLSPRRWAVDVFSAHRYRSWDCGGRSRCRAAAAAGALQCRCVVESEAMVPGRPRARVSDAPFVIGPHVGTSNVAHGRLSSQTHAAKTTMCPPAPAPARRIGEAEHVAQAR